MSEKKYENELFVKLIEDEFGAKKVVVCPLELALVPGPVCWKRDPDSPFKFDFKDLQIASPPFEIHDCGRGRQSHLRHSAANLRRLVPNRCLQCLR